MPPLLRCAFITVFVLTACVSAVPTKTVVGVAGRRVRLPCRTAAARQGGVEVCWGRGEPSVFSCQNAVFYAVGNRIIYRESHRYSLYSSSSLTIFSARTTDSGWYHCRVHLPGLFNDQTATVHLIVADPSFKVSSTTEASLFTDDTDLNTPHVTPQCRFTVESGDVAVDNSTRPVVPRVQSVIKQKRANSLLGFIGNTMRTSFIIVIPALLLTAAYRFCRTNKRVKTDGELNQTQEEENSV